MKPYHDRTEYINRAMLAAEKFNDGYSVREIANSEGLTRRDYARAIKLGLIQPRSKSEARSICISKYGPNIPGIEFRKKLSVEQSLNNRGGKCKWYEVSGQMVQGTWERDIAHKLNEMGIIWYKPKVHSDVIEYTCDGCTRSYTPDFYLPEYNLYLEIKGHWWGDDKKKMQLVLDQHPEIKIKVIEKTEFKKLMGGELVW